jgi:hypothetical protein
MTKTEQVLRDRYSNSCNIKYVYLEAPTGITVTERKVEEVNGKYVYEYDYYVNIPFKLTGTYFDRITGEIKHCSYQGIEAVPFDLKDIPLP